MSDDEKTEQSEQDGTRDEMQTGSPSAKGLKPKSEWTQEELDELERERAEILAPENRPENAEVDNTDREFELERGDFVDNLDDSGDSGDSGDTGDGETA